MMLFGGQMLSVRIALVPLLLAGSAAVAAPSPGAPVLHLCIQHVTTPDSEEDFREAFSLGPIRIPAGAVFDWSGHVFGSASDPRDDSHHTQPPGSGWSGVSAEENERRLRVNAEDMTRNQRDSSALVTLAEVRLTKTSPCADVPVAAARSEDWGWKQAPIFGASNIFYSAYGVIRSTGLDTSWSNDREPFSHAAQRGELNGILRGTTSRVIAIPAP